MPRKLPPHKVSATLALAGAVVVVGTAWTVGGGPAQQPAVHAAAPPATTPSAQPIAAAALPPPPDLVEAAFEQFAMRPCATSLSGTKPHVAMAGNFLRTLFPVKDIGGMRAGGRDDHTTGLALDFMVPNAALGTALANYVLTHQQKLGVSYLIWQQRYNDGHGWSMMENRGSPTANHYDHVHVSFRPSANPQVSC